MKNVIVSGIPRSGLTMTMQMLNAGGFPCAGNYPGFEPFEMFQIPFEKCKGMAVKSIDTHLQFPPSDQYYVIRTRRNHKEQAKSIAKFTQLTLGIAINRSGIKAVEKSLPKDYKLIDNWANKQHKHIIIDFEDTLKDPRTTALMIRDLIEEDLNIEKMVDVVVKRDPECYDGLLEAKMV